jgi:hypothetical protein
MPTISESPFAGPDCSFTPSDDLGYPRKMAINNQAVQLTPEQLRLLGEWSARTGKPAQELLAEALGEFQPHAAEQPANGQHGESLSERLSRKGMLGCLAGGPSDLSTNPDHMEGFGE